MQDNMGPPPRRHSVFSHAVFDEFSPGCVPGALTAFLLASPHMSDTHVTPPLSDSAPKPLKIAKITVDRDLCIGAAPCVTVAPGVFQLDDENKAYVVDPKGADDDMILLAAQACPVQAIILHDEEGNQIYP